MKFTVAKKDLKDALDSVAPARRAHSGLTSHYLFRRPLNGDMTKVEVLTHAGNMIACCPFIAQIEQVEPDDKFAFTVDSGMLGRWLNARDDAALVFRADQASGKAWYSEVGSNYPPRDSESLDYSAWPKWEPLFDDAKEVAVINAERLQAALIHSGKLCAKDETKQPDLCACVVKDGNLIATDAIVMSVVSMKELDKSTWKIHRTAIAGVTTFLGSIKGDVQIKEHTRTIFFIRPDGALVGTSQASVNFPDVKPPAVVPCHFWTIAEKNVLRGVNDVGGTVDDQDEKMIFTVVDDKNLGLSIKRKTGAIPPPAPVLLLERTSDANAIPIPNWGLVLSKFRMLNIMKQYEKENIQFAVIMKPKGGGYVKFTDTRFVDSQTGKGDEYITIMMTLKVD